MLTGQVAPDAFRDQPHVLYPLPDIFVFNGVKHPGNIGNCLFYCPFRVHAHFSNVSPRPLPKFFISQNHQMGIQNRAMFKHIPRYTLFYGPQFRFCFRKGASQPLNFIFNKGPGNNSTVDTAKTLTVKKIGPANGNARRNGNPVQYLSLH